MTRNYDEYGGKEITIVDDEGADGPPEIIIDGKRLNVLAEESGYYTRFLPYRRYASLENLSRDLVDHWATIEGALEEVEDA
ncbi:hypothetical protein [Natronorarus salvus]|uniref:hypothetical protein n=1 Tax=Natronorarus salvus TaxID=3117733 RepID=UPI002F260102